MIGYNVALLQLLANEELRIMLVMSSVVLCVASSGRPDLY